MSPTARFWLTERGSRENTVATMHRQGGPLGGSSRLQPGQRPRRVREAVGFHAELLQHTDK